MYWVVDTAKGTVVHFATEETAKRLRDRAPGVRQVYQTQLGWRPTCDSGSASAAQQVRMNGKRLD